MAITNAMCNSFKQELLEAKHNFLAAGGHTFKIALFLTSATLGAATTNYSNTGEVAAGGGYTQGGVGLTNVNPSLDTGTAITDFNPDVTWAASTITAGGALIYNFTTAPNTRAVAALTFGGDKISSAGDFTVTFPAPAAATAIIRIA